MDYSPANTPDETYAPKWRTACLPLWPLVLPILLGVGLVVWEGFLMLAYIERCSHEFVSCEPPFRILLWLGMIAIAAWCLLWSLCMVFLRRWRRAGIFLILTGGTILLTISEIVLSAYKMLVLIGF